MFLRPYGGPPLSCDKNPLTSRFHFYGARPLPASPTEYLTTECPNGHRVRGDIGWLNRDVRCPHCDAEFSFQRPEGTAAEVIAPNGSKMVAPQSVSDTGVMRILGDFANTGLQDDGTTRLCSNCGATYPSYVPTCYNCNLDLKGPVQQREGADTSGGIDFHAINPFPFRDVPLGQLMRPQKNIDWLDVNMPLEMILNRVRAMAHTRYPVCDGSLEKVIGLVHIEDIVLADESNFAIKNIIRPLELLPETMAVSEALHRLQRTGEPVAMVVDDRGTVQGIVTVKDIILKIVKTP
jgi:CBS domain-containing protein